MIADLVTQCASACLATSPPRTQSPGVRGMTRVTPTPAGPGPSVFPPGSAPPASVPRDTRETPSCHAGNIFTRFIKPI